MRQVDIYYKKWKYTPAVRSKMSSKLIFASCVWYSDRAHYELCVLIKDIGRRLPLQLQCSYQGQQDDFSQSVRGNYKTRFWGGQNLTAVKGNIILWTRVDKLCFYKWPYFRFHYFASILVRKIFVHNSSSWSHKILIFIWYHLYYWVMSSYGKIAKLFPAWGIIFHHLSVNYTGYLHY